MSQWDGMPESPPPAPLLGKQGQRAVVKVRDAVVAMEKPPTEDQVRTVTTARQEMMYAVRDDPEFKPEDRIAELEGALVEHLREIEGLVSELSAQKGALRWKQNPLAPYRPVPLSSVGPMARRVRQEHAPMTASQLVAVLRETLGVTEAPVEMIAA